MRLRRTLDAPVAPDRGADAFGVVHVFVAAEPPESGLPQQSRHPALSVSSGSRVHEPLNSDFGQSESIAEFPEGDQSSIRNDLGVMEFQLQTTVKIKPQNPSTTFTRRVGHSSPSNIRITA